MSQVRIWMFWLLGSMALILLTLLPAFAQETGTKKPWTGKLRDGQKIMQADLDQILQAHAPWCRSGGKEGQQADLSNANLSKAYLKEANLGAANLSGTDLTAANMSGALLRATNLTGATLWGAQPERGQTERNKPEWR